MAAHAVALRGGNVLLVHQVAPGPAQNRWTLPGGALEPGETGPEAVIREVTEECGLRTEVGELLGVHRSTHRREDDSLRRDIRLLYAARVTGVPAPDTTGEIDAVGWFAWDDLPESVTAWVTAGVQWATDHPYGCVGQRPTA